MHYSTVVLEEEYTGFGKSDALSESQLLWLRQNDHGMDAYFPSLDTCYPNPANVWHSTVDQGFDPTFAWNASGCDFIHDVEVISPASLMHSSACASPVSGGLPSLCDTDTATEYHSGNVTPVLMDANFCHRSQSPMTQMKFEQLNGQFNARPSRMDIMPHREIWPTNEMAYHPYDPTLHAQQAELEKANVLPSTPKSLPELQDSACNSPKTASQHRPLESEPASPTPRLKRSLSDIDAADDLECDFKQDDEDEEEDEYEEDVEEEDEDEDDGSDDYDDAAPTKRKASRVQSMAGKKTRKNYSKDITRVLMNWYLTNNGLLPDQETKTTLAGLTNKTSIQISTWYQNARRRHHLKLRRFQTLHAQNPNVVFDYESLMSYLKDQKVKHMKRAQEPKRSRRRFN
ncbi:hypothetical protein K450DRAFT_135608 [Umbelopsis ramanniana AG]|uniref:Homeobox domain-containing protein n=1 Tax=Umbelopsis ramanniana AG TaxID=1314678 RepID=A0AAD5E247_UMBRA|nr:uncharacterized protein K450DRAFT_135608 [Umbelopsis ramanniana AG]KAI8575798.1 hypothetical protein K450DRAFT_135608 [Umbelopsis ramanniana AG]